MFHRKASRGATLLFIVALSLLTVGCQQAAEAPTATGPEDPSRPEVPASGDLRTRLVEGWGLVKGDAIRIEDFFYHPSGVLNGPYEGYDLLVTRDVSDRAFAFHLRLRRDATVVLAWPDGKEQPGFASTWDSGPGMLFDGIYYDTFRTVLEAGSRTLPPFGTLNATPLLLIGEADGQPSGYPRAPEGLPQPQPNRACPDWVHDQYVVEHDDATYRTWHPQIDPVFACTFGHEHGSDPREFAGDRLPMFDRYAGMPTPDGGTLHSEAHAGFKVFVTAPHDGVEIMATLHATSSMQGRVCTRFHATDKVFADADTGEILAELAYKGDFGFPRINGGDRLDPTACPDAIEVTGTDGRRDINPPTTQNGYEPWLEGLSTAEALPLEGKLFWALDNPQTKCADTVRCDEVIPVGVDGADGTRRWMDLLDSFAVDASEGEWGTFCTDVYGMGRIGCDEAGAVRQYVQPGFEWRPTRARFSVHDPFLAEYRPSTDLVVFNIDRNINGSVPVGGTN